jgi:dCMP deaminase
MTTRKTRTGMPPEAPRPTWEEYALRLAEVAAARSQDPWEKVGACVLRADHSVASLGYNGAPPGVEIDWSDRERRRPYVLHAEVNALRYLRPGEGLLMAVTHSPCADCLRAIAAWRIPRVIYRRRYEATWAQTRKLASRFGIQLALGREAATRRRHRS